MYSPQDAFRPHFKALAGVGYYKIVSETVTPTEVLLHNIYRIIIWILVVATNIQVIIRTCQFLYDIDELINMLLIDLSLLTILFKQITFNTKERQISNAISVISDIEYISQDIYAYYEQEVKKCGTFMYRFMMVFSNGTLVCSMLWVVGPFVKRLLGEDVQLFMYFPWNTNSSLGFNCAIIYVGLSFVVQSYGNSTMDCIVPGLYIQAITQFKILKYSLENLLVEDKNNTTTGRGLDRKGYEDIIHERLVKCVKQYDRIAWFVKEVDTIFNIVITILFLVTCVIICTTIYIIVGVDILSSDFLIMFLSLCVILVQPFLYCYYGSQLKYQSEIITHAIFNTKWEKLTPRIRRELIIFMERCKRPVGPRIASIVPLSLNTYITILRSSYALYAVMKRKETN